MDALDKPARRTIIAAMTAQTEILQEVEAKLLAPGVATLAAIAQVRHLGPYRLRPRQTVCLHTVYLDTPQFTLARQQVALRLRRTRMRWEASVKWSGQEDGMVHARPELTVRLARPPTFPLRQLPEPFAALLSEFIAGQRLVPILISDVRRQRFAVRVSGQAAARTIAELALDKVHLRAPGPRRRAIAAYCEVEIELESGGTVQEVVDCARLLKERFALTLAEGSKFSRGLTLLYGSGLIGS